MLLDSGQQEEFDSRFADIVMDESILADRDAQLVVFYQLFSMLMTYLTSEGMTQEAYAVANVENLLSDKNSWDWRTTTSMLATIIGTVFRTMENLP